MQTAIFSQISIAIMSVARAGMNSINQLMLHSYWPPLDLLLHVNQTDLSNKLPGNYLVRIQAYDQESRPPPASPIQLISHASRNKHSMAFM